MERTLRFDGPSAYLVPNPKDPSGPRVPRGETFTCSDERAEEHLTAPSYDCSEVTPGQSSSSPNDPERGETPGYFALMKRSREKVNQLAEQVGVPDPEGLSAKTDVVRAIQAIRDEPEAQEGEGPTDNPNEEES